MLIADGSEIRVGPAGWSYEDWKGIVYPTDASSRFDPLEYIAGYFDLVEVNSSFYRIPDPRVGSSWAARVESNVDFLFTVKLHQDFTHAGSYPGDGEVRAFRSFLEPLDEQGRLGCLLAQFPGSFRDGDRSRARVEKIRRDFADLPLAVEVRNDSFGTGFADFLRQRDIAAASIDLPDLAGFAKPSEEVTAGIGYVRFHGRNSERWFDHEHSWERYDYLYSQQELGEWGSRIERMKAKRIFVVMNNHFRGQAIANAVELRRNLGENVRVPRSVAEYYGEERFEGVEIDGPPQLKLPF